MRSIILAILLSISSSGYTQQHSFLEKTNDLYRTGQVAAQHNKPIMVFFNASYCRPCEMLKERALYTLLRFNHFPEGVQFVEIFIDSKKELIDFYGETISPEDFALFYNVAELPTQVFVDASGNVIAPPIVNNGAYEFYGSLVNNRLNQAQSFINNVP